MADTAYLNIADVAKRFGVTTSTVYRLAQRRKLPGFKIGGQWRFSERALEHWVMDQSCTGTARRNEDG
jgi:excisionase family DNA binding protein